MNYNSSSFARINLLSRNEGKIKSYESCLDLRGWSHESDKRNRYLREWIKSEMPKSVIPVRILLSVVDKMTRCNSSLVAPRCHKNCKSKLLLESICNSYDEIKECLRKDKSFDKFFEEEQFETSHWPCDRCLVALKSIKLLWKIIVEKVLGINIPGNQGKFTCCADSVNSVAKLWQADIKKQTAFVKNSQHHLSQSTYACTWSPTSQKKTQCNFEQNCTNSNEYKVVIRHSKTTDTQDLLNTFKGPGNQKLDRYTSTKCLAVDASCNVNLNSEITIYKANLNCLRGKLDAKHNEIEKLKTENDYLKMELRTLYKNSWCKAFQNPVLAASFNDFTEKIKPYETCDCEEYIDTNPPKLIDSEMIITMKNCANESYKHISLFQILHKTNDPDISELAFKTPGRCKKEDPIALLEKVQNTFGAIMSRERSRANDRICCEESVDIDASCHNAIAKLEPSSLTATLSGSDE